MSVVKQLDRFNQSVVEKAGGHKYIRREGSAATGYRYIYAHGPTAASRGTRTTRFAEGKHSRVKPVLADLERLSRKIQSVREGAKKWEGDREMVAGEHRDASRLTAFHRAVARGDLVGARKHHQKMDTAVREHVPARLLNYVYRGTGRS